MGSKSIDFCKAMSGGGGGAGSEVSATGGAGAGIWWSSPNCAAADIISSVNSGVLHEYMLNKAILEISPRMSLNFNMWANLVTFSDGCEMGGVGDPFYPPDPCKRLVGSDGGAHFAIYMEVWPTDQMPTDQMPTDQKPTDRDLKQMSEVLQTIVATPHKWQPGHVAVLLNFAGEIKDQKRPIYMRYAYLTEVVVSETLQQEILNRIEGFGSTVVLNPIIAFVSAIICALWALL
jgi:hypothetical protein